MASKDFDKWISNFEETLRDYKYYVDFEKVYENAKKYRAELCLMNSLIGSKNIEKEFLQLYKKYPSIIKCIPTLLAVRGNTIDVVTSTGIFKYDFNNINYSIKQYLIFMKETGLFDLISKHIIKDLYDYAIGVEVGMNSNARKNRAGSKMENVVEQYFIKKGIQYSKQTKASIIQSKYGVDLSPITNNGQTEKKFDFVLKKNKEIYGIEVNFYSTNGSKLPETARSYKEIAEKSINIKHFHFIWITDGKGWQDSAKNNLKETFDVMEDIYSLKELYEGHLDKYFKTKNNIG